MSPNGRTRQQARLTRPARRRVRVIRVGDGEIVCYDDYMDPIALARLLGRTGELAAALTGA
jgi:ketosteroid isomerase-like protein